MKKKNHIQLKSNAHIPCLRIWCGYCKTMVKTCDGKPLADCSHTEKLQYRFVGFIPGTKNRIVRSLGTDFNEAVKQAATLRQQLDSGEIDKHQPQVQPPVVISMPHVKPELLVHVFGKYVATLKGEGVASHLKLVRSKSHVDDVKNCMKQFALALQRAGYDVKNFKLAEINDEIVGKFHDYLIAEEYSDAVYNRWFSHLTTFGSWVETEKYGSAKHFFERVPRKTITPQPETITKDEFEKVLSVISYENGFQEGIGKDKQRRNHYRNYLISAFQFALNGRRLEELIMARFCDIQCDANDTPLIIEFTDYKVSRILHTPVGKERKLHSPVTDEMARFLYAQGFAQKRNSNEYIIAPEIKHNRVAAVKSALTRGFSHFWKVAHPGKPVKTFKVLRKVVMTALKIRLGDDVASVSGHADEQTLRHYVNEKQVALATDMKDFSVFDQKKKLKRSRKSQSKDNTIEH